VKHRYDDKRSAYRA